MEKRIQAVKVRGKVRLNVFMNLAQSIIHREDGEVRTLFPIMKLAKNY